MLHYSERGKGLNDSGVNMYKSENCENEDKDYARRAIEIRLEE